MKIRHFLALVLLSALMGACGGSTTPGGGTQPPAPGSQPKVDIERAVCVDGSNTPCSDLPKDVPSSGPGYNGLSSDQANFDFFSWQTFIALNWPADPDGSPLSGPIGSAPDAARVWQSYKTPGEVFDPGTPYPCPKHAAPILELDSKIEAASHSTEFSEAFSGPLIDRNGNFAVFDVRMNPQWMTYVTAPGNNLNTYQGQEAFSGEVSFPQGCNAADGEECEVVQVGATELKSSWVIVPEGQEEAFSDHFTLDAFIGLDASETSTGKPACLQHKVALTGMHVVVRTLTDGDEWIWGTFEHQRTAPFADQPIQPFSSDKTKIPAQKNVDACTATPPVSDTFSFFEQDCTQAGSSCKPNTQPQLGTGEKDFRWQLDDPSQGYAANYLIDGKYGTQATRCWSIYENTRETNARWQAALAGTVWANYELMGTQWEVPGDGPPPKPSIYIPAFLANATMETYFQTTASCLSCHANAKLKAQPTKSANFSWLLNQDVLENP